MNGSKFSPWHVVALVAALAAGFAPGFASAPAAETMPARESAPVPEAAPAASGAATAPNAGPAAPASAEPRGQIQGSAMVRRNVPVVGAVVNVRRRGDTSDLRVTTSDGRGAFRIDALADGRYRVEVAREGFATVVKDDVDLRAPFRAVVEVTMAKAVAGVGAPDAAVVGPGASTSSAQAASASSAQAASAGSAPGTPVALRGVVRDREGRESGEVRVRIIRPDGSEDPREAVTTARGGFSFDDLTPGVWRLEIQGAGLLPIRTTVTLSEATELAAVLVPQPAEYAPAIEDLMPREEPIPPR